MIVREKHLKYSLRKNVYYLKNTNKLFSGKVIDIDENNQKLEINLLNGIYHGKSLFYYSNENIRKEENYKDGIKHGKWIRFYENGNKDLQMLYNNGNLETGKMGAWKKWKEDGHLEEQRIYYKEDYYFTVLLEKNSTTNIKKVHCLFCDGSLLPIQGKDYLYLITPISLLR